MLPSGRRDASSPGEAIFLGDEKLDALRVVGHF
jgi:hypothetical protein